MRLKDKVALVTGGGQGIGKLTALTFAREGARVVIADINMAAAQATAAEIEQADGQAKPVFLDVSRADSVEAAFQALTNWAGGIDILINNAGITRDARMQKMSEEQFDSVISVNLKGVWLCAKAAAPSMIARGGGAIVNTASVVGLYGNFGQTNYVAAKAGVIGMTKTWARELGPSNIRVNAVAPGFTSTEMIATVPDKVLDSVRERTPLRRLGRPEDIANAYLFLSSEDASFITGVTLSVDGGLLF
ncbi:3-oxoacyl-ACP reductase FabG [Candidatus Viridilinea mediisalina]|uniref:3-oxoacyl-ACP reductase n=1 Tax=Candidatus Viridilinea mediisalina TaxID=2024553 RepID=A0A2A6RM07_9CHLR|nr:3-oxoacyl-ACP reductase FabG [Candidatus Viridilinea mediisalina]PDW03931.1 3-oxoacyl-ACP reductase [Candidatus Viridilinea mediisalina]